LVMVTATDAIAMSPLNSKERMMIVETIVYACPKCGSENIVRNGRDYKGAQKYYCHDCNSYGTLDEKSTVVKRQFIRRKTAAILQ